MARAKRCEEEFNPWPPFVDVFSSVILVLLLFILVVIVNVAYYMQFNQKVVSESTTTSQRNNLVAGKDNSDLISLQKMIKPSLDAAGRDSLFSGGESEGNAMSTPKDKEKKIVQSITKVSNKELIVAYSATEIFLSSSAKNQIKSFIKKHKGSVIEISIANPMNISSTSMKKQVSLGRALNMKNALKKMDTKLSNMKLNIKSVKDDNFMHGYVKIKIL
jgi:hypothetical protein